MTSGGFGRWIVVEFGETREAIRIGGDVGAIGAHDVNPLMRQV